MIGFTTTKFTALTKLKMHVLYLVGAGFLFFAVNTTSSIDTPLLSVEYRRAVRKQSVAGISFWTTQVSRCPILCALAETGVPVPRAPSPGSPARSAALACQDTLCRQYPSQSHSIHSIWDINRGRSSCGNSNSSSRMYDIDLRKLREKTLYGFLFSSKKKTWVRTTGPTNDGSWSSRHEGMSNNEKLPWWHLYSIAFSSLFFVPCPKVGSDGSHKALRDVQYHCHRYGHTPSILSLRRKNSALIEP